MLLDSCSPAAPISAPIHSSFQSGTASCSDLLLAQYTLTGYDASAHVTEETVGAARRAPWGIVMSIVVSALAGIVLLVGLTIAIPDVDPTTKASGLATVGTLGIGAVPYILSTRLGSDAAFVIFGLILVAQFFCGMSSVTANSRMIYAFSRDGAVPGSSLWHSLNRRRIPANAVWLAGGAAFALGIPVLWNSVVFLAVVSISVVAIYIAYVLPTFTRLLSRDFTPGPWNLGRFSKPIGWVAVVWVVFISILFVLPQATPITRDTFNYAGVVVFGAIILAHDLVAGQCAQVVQRTNRPGRRSHARADRGGDQPRKHLQRAECNQLDETIFPVFLCGWVPGTQPQTCSEPSTGRHESEV